MRAPGPAALYRLPPAAGEINHAISRLMDEEPDQERTLLTARRSWRSEPAR